MRGKVGRMLKLVPDVLEPGEQLLFDVGAAVEKDLESRLDGFGCAHSFQIVHWRLALKLQDEKEEEEEEEERTK